MPLLNMKKTSGKATKVAVSLDASLNDDLDLYADMQEQLNGEKPAASALIREMVKEFLKMDKDFIAFKKQGGATKKAPEPALNGAQMGDSFNA